MLAWSLVPAEIDNLALFLALGSAAAVIFSMAKAGFGGSSGMLAVPMMIFACDGNVALATGIMLPVLIAADYVAVISWLGKWRWRAVWMLLPGTVLGVAAGWAAIHFLGRLDAGGGKALANAWLQLGVGLIALGFVALQAVRAVRGRPLVFRPVFWQGSCAGSAAGFSSTIAHAAGPIITMYMLPQQMPKGQYVATTALFFFIANQVKLVPYFAEGMINASTLGAGVVLLPGIAAGAVVGVLLHKRVRQEQFTGIVHVLLAVAGAGLCYKAIPTLLS